MKKVATLTFQNADNYGAMLQCYALQHAINKIDDVEAKVLNYQCSYMLRPFGVRALKRKGIVRYILGNVNACVRKFRHKKFQEFRKKIPMTEPLSRCKLDRIESEFDLFIVGSDCVWNDDITNKDSTFLLDFIKDNNKKGSYAASFGFQNVDIKLIEYYKPLLEKFKYINCREKSGVYNVKKICNKNANLVLDPTILLSKKEWNEIAISPKSDGKYIFVYQLSPSKLLEYTVYELQKKTGYKVITIPFPLGGKYKTKKDLFAGPREWIGYIKDAEYIVTDSFHGTVFSTLFEKQFFSCINENGTRIVNILTQLGMEQYIYTNDSKPNLSRTPIEYNLITPILNEKRKESIDILKKMIIGE